jgi:glycosyltransferase involved in cell wall biosynthesis
LSVYGRIAILTPFQRDVRIGGVEIFCNQIQKALGPANVFAASERPLPKSDLLARFGLLDPARAAIGAHDFQRSHGSDPYDLVLSNGLFGWPLRFSPPNVPMIQIYHFTLAGLARTALPARGDLLTTARVGAWFDRASGVGKHVVAVSNSVRREVFEFYGHRASVIPNSVDVHAFHKIDRAEARERLSLPKDKTLGLFVGRAEYAKGFDILVDVAASSPDILFLCASKPATAPRNVRFFTDVPHGRMPLLYSAADFLFSPSRYEGFNLSLLEGLACELPAVVSRQAYPFSNEPVVFATVVKESTAAAFAVAIRETMKEGPRPGVRARIVEHYSSDVFRNNWRNFALSAMMSPRLPA